MRLMVDAAAGVRVRFSTSATRIALRVKVQAIALGTDSPYQAVVDLAVDGIVSDSRPVHGVSARLDFDADTVQFAAAVEEEVVFEGLPARPKLIELWLPHTAVVDVVSVAADDEIHRAPEPVGRRWIHHGSSISHCLEASTPTRTWPAVAATDLGLELTDLGFAGNAMLDPFVARAIRDRPADMISLKLGINIVNTDALRERAFGPAVHGFLDTIRDGHPDVPVIVITPIVCPAVESAPGPTSQDATKQFVSTATEPYPNGALTLSTIRRIVTEIVRERAESDPHLFLIDGRDLFGDADVAAGHLPDGLHPDEAGYRLMGERFADITRWQVPLPDPTAPPEIRQLMRIPMVEQ